MFELYLKSIGLLLATVLLSGCVGAGSVSGHHIVGDEDGTSSSVPARYSGICPVNNPGHNVVGCSDSAPHIITPQEVIKARGKPASDELTDGYRKFIYRQNGAWRGAVVFVIIPLPLLVPFGHDDTTFTFKNDQLIRVEYDLTRLDAAVCGYTSEATGFACVPDWH